MSRGQMSGSVVQWTSGYPGGGNNVDKNTRREHRGIVREYRGI